MIAYYTFESGGHPPDRLPNLASTGDSLDGTLGGEQGLPAWTQGRWKTKGALQFSRGTGQHVVLGGGQGSDPLDFSRGSEIARPFTMAVWVKGAPSQAWGAGLISRGTGTREEFTMDVFADRIRAFVRESGGVATQGVQGVASNVAPAGRWHYVVAVYEPIQGSFCLYIDGILIGENKFAPHVLLSAETPVSIGSRQGLPGKFSETLDGLIDEVAIWGRALSPEEIRSNYESGKPD